MAVYGSMDSKTTWSVDVDSTMYRWGWMFSFYGGGGDLDPGIREECIDEDEDTERYGVLATLKHIGMYLL